MLNRHAVWPIKGGHTASRIYFQMTVENSPLEEWSKNSHRIVAGPKAELLGHFVSESDDIRLVNGMQSNLVKLEFNRPSQVPNFRIENAVVAFTSRGGQVVPFWRGVLTRCARSLRASAIFVKAHAGAVKEQQTSEGRAAYGKGPEYSYSS